MGRDSRGCGVRTQNVGQTFLSAAMNRQKCLFLDIGKTISFTRRWPQG